MPGVAAYAILGIDRQSLWSPAVVLGLSHAQRSGLHETGGTASFALDAVSLDACAIRYRRSVLEARACAAGLLGQLSAHGTDTFAGASAYRPFATAGAAGMLGVRLGSRIELLARLGAGYALVRDSFEFAPNVFYRVAPVITTATLALELHEP
jgi:hypothetical protein